MSSIDRVRYYDGEFLRAFDFGDEQTYHLEMRRRLNRYLHLYGIAEGLQLSADTQGSITQVSILPGLAIDALGREIYVFAPYTLGNPDISANRISLTGPYDVWLRYNKTAAMPPSSGYVACNQTNQYTRWLESYSVVLLPSPSSPFAPPDFSEDDTDTPGQDGIGVFLGTITVDPTSVTAQFSKPQFHHRRFLGLIAQHIQTPRPYDATKTFQFLNQNTPHQPAASLEIEPNIFARQNLILGPDFDLSAANPSPAPSGNIGNAKVAGDLFVQGNLYSNITVGGVQQWLGVSQYVQQLVQQLMPEIVVATPVPVVVANFDSAAGLVQGTTQLTAKTARLKSVSSNIVLAGFSQVQTAVGPDFGGLFTAGAQIQLGITTPPPPATFIGQNGSVNVSWQAGPAAGLHPATNCAITNFTISCVMICFP